MKSKGALIWEFNQHWSIEEIEIGDPVKDEVKIQLEAAGMCHSEPPSGDRWSPDGGLPGADRSHHDRHRGRGPGWRPDCSTSEGIWPDIDLCVQTLKVDINIVTTAELDHRARRTKDVDIAWYQFSADISFRARAARAGRRQHWTGNDRSSISSQAVAEAKPAHKDTIRSITWPGLSVRGVRQEGALQEMHQRSITLPTSSGSGSRAAPPRHRIRWHK